MSLDSTLMTSDSKYCSRIGGKDFCRTVSRSALCSKSQDGRHLGTASSWIFKVILSWVTAADTERAKATALSLCENCGAPTVFTGKDSHGILTNLGSQRPRERCRQEGAWGPLSLPPRSQASDLRTVISLRFWEPWGKPRIVPAHTSLPNKPVYHLI